MSYYIEKYGLNKQEVEAWGREHYPEFAGNLNLIAQLYLTKVLGITPKPPVPREKVVPVRSVHEGDRTVIRVLVTAKVAERSYTGCPHCRRKINGNVCPGCGVVTPIEYKWLVYLAGDTSGEIIVSFPPGVDVPDDLIGRVMWLDGSYKGGEFLVTNFDFDEPRKLPAVSTPAPAQDQSSNVNISPTPTNTQEQSHQDNAHASTPSSARNYSESGGSAQEPTTTETEEPATQQVQATNIPEQTDPVWQQDREKFMLLIKYFGGTTILREEFETWKQRVGIQTPDEVAFQRLGFVETEEGIKIPKLPGDGR